MSKLTLHTEDEHKYALSIVEDWMLHQESNPPANLNALIDAIVEYEKIHYPIGWEE